MKNQLSRRQFLKAAGAAASTTVLGHSLLRSGTAFAAQTFVRRNVGGMDASDPVIVSYRAAIKAMQALPTTNPLSWAYQAAIHGTTSAPLTAWSTCQHHNYFFWSWHRMYLYWWERIVRKMSGDNCWALPYWDWSATTQRQLPAMFRDTSSELYTSHRNAAMNSGAGSLPAGVVNVTGGMGLINFTSASSSLEGNNHDFVHVDVGGWMGSVPTAAQDPIFFLHHANMDRLWDLWLAQGGGRTDPLGDSTWTKTKFTFFDESGAQVQMTGCDVLRAAQQLHYTYEGEPPQVNEYCRRVFREIIFVREVLFQLPLPPVILESEPVSFPVDITPLRQRLAAIAESKTETLFLELDDVEAERSPGVGWEVYFGLPPNTEPDSESPFHVGNLVLFSSGIRSDTHHGFKPAEFAFPIDRAVLAALAAGEGRVLVTFIPTGILIDGKPSRPKVMSPVRIGAARLTAEIEKQQ